nr:hypothetical protein [Herbidospora cretacea]
MGKVMIGNYEASIYREGTGWTGAISLGFDSAGKRLRPKHKGRTKAEVKDKLKELVEDLETGIEAAANYTVGTLSATSWRKVSKAEARAPSPTTPHWRTTTSSRRSEVRNSSS